MTTWLNNALVYCRQNVNVMRPNGYLTRLHITDARPQTQAFECWRQAASVNCDRRFGGMSNHRRANRRRPALMLTERFSRKPGPRWPPNSLFSEDPGQGHRRTFRKIKCLLPCRASFCSQRLSYAPVALRFSE